MVDVTTSPIEVTVTDGGISVEIGTSYGTPGVSVIYNSSITTPGDGEYNDWDTLVAALATLPDVPKHIWFQQDETIPAGTYNMQDATLHGTGQFGPVYGITVTFADGAVLTNMGRLFAEGGITLHSVSTVPVYTISQAPAQVYLESDASVMCDTCEFFRITADTGDGLVFFSVRFGGGFFRPDTFTPGATSYEVLNNASTLGVGEMVLAFPAGNGRLRDDTIRSTDNLTILAVVATGAGMNQPGDRTGFSHANAGGGVYTALLTDARNLGFTPTTGGHWDGSPSNVGSALDELASRVATLEP